MPVKATATSLARENEELRARLAQVEETLRAIRSGEVDALVVESAGEDRVFTLQAADQTYRLMVEAMQEGAVTLSEDGVVLYCNRALAALLDVPLEALTGAPLARYLDEPWKLDAMLQPDAGGGGEVSFRASRGPVPARVSVTRLTLGDLPVFCLVVTDLTETRRREQERAQLEREREARVAAEAAHRVAQEEIARRQQIEDSLRQAAHDRIELLAREHAARAEAEAANRLKDEFLATVSHELRTPLSAIVAWSHVLRQPDLDPATMSRALEAIDRNATTQARLVADILDVSRIVTGQFHLALVPVRLADAVEAAVEAVRPAAHTRDIRLELAFAPGAGAVLGDQNRLQQVAWNLLSNAVRFAPVGGLVDVRVADAGAWAELTVVDDGPGIDPEFLPHMLNRFQQADSSSTRCHPGLGLGLSIVRHLVELHGGTVAARNRDGRTGAEFTVRLPRRE